MIDLEEAFKLIQNNRGVARFSGPKPEELARGAEVALGLVFPPTYRTFLLRLGAGSLMAEEFYGITKGGLTSPSVPNAIWLTLNERRKRNLPESVIIVGDNGVGGRYVIDTSKKNADGDSPVVDWWPNNLPSQVVADDFGAFLLQRLYQAIR